MSRFRGRRLRGLVHVRRLLQRLPDSVSAEMAKVMEEVRPAAVAIAKAGAPVRRGKLRAAIDGQVYVKSLRFRVGLLTKKIARENFYGHILEVGRKAQSIPNIRRSKPSGGFTTYAKAMEVKAIHPTKYDMVGGYAKDRIRALFRSPLNKLFDRALRDAARGAGDPNA
jgi:hypothetical protein